MEIVLVSSYGPTVNGEIVKSEHIQTAVNRFIEWERKYLNVVVAHNDRRFDFPLDQC